MEETCQDCHGEGLVHQGESITRTCPACLGRGKVEASVPEQQPPVEPEIPKDPGTDDGSEPTTAPTVPNE